MDLFKKYSLYWLSAYGLLVALTALVRWEAFSPVQRCVAMMTVIVVLHEWEEQCFPGGFIEMMGKMMGLDVAKLDIHGMAARPDGFIAGLTLLALIFDEMPFFACAILYLGIFEGLVHVLGIRLTGTSKPYTPGMVTAFLYAAAAVAAIVYLVGQSAVSAGGWLAGGVWLLVAFAAMEISVWRVAGLTPSEVKARMHANVQALLSK